MSDWVQSACPSPWTCLESHDVDAAVHSNQFVRNNDEYAVSGRNIGVVQPECEILVFGGRVARVM